MANLVPSKVTGNTSFGRFLNEDRILSFCNSCIEYICNKLNLKAHGVLSFDLKEDREGNMKVTECNIRHMAYYHYEKPYIFLRDVDIEPIILDRESELLVSYE